MLFDILETLPKTDLRFAISQPTEQTNIILLKKCRILTLDRAVNQRCTCVNKREKKREHVGFMKEYRQVPAAVELAEDRIAKVRASLKTEGCGPQRPPVEQPQQRCGRSTKWVLEDNTACYGQEKKWVNIAVCPCLHSSLTHHRNIENKVWETYFYKEVYSSVHWSW